jgi:hypothetical protein
MRDNDGRLWATDYGTQALVPGTTVNFVGIQDDVARAQTIELLKSLR